jgi:hypothetical protein
MGTKKETMKIRKKRKRIGRKKIRNQANDDKEERKDATWKEVEKTERNR